PRALRSSPTRRSSDLHRGEFAVPRGPWAEGRVIGALTAPRIPLHWSPSTIVERIRPAHAQLRHKPAKRGLFHARIHLQRAGNLPDRKSTRLNSSHVKI